MPEEWSSPSYSMPHAPCSPLFVSAQASGPAERLYQAARVYALASAAAQKDEQASPADRAKLAEQYAARAVELLVRAERAGYFATPARLADLKTDPDLATLRTRQAFNSLLREAEGRGKPGVEKGPGTSS